MNTIAEPISPKLDSTTQLFGSFYLGEFELALPIQALQEVVAFPSAITPVPMAPAHLLGLFNLRGMLVPVVHLGRFLGLPETDYSQARVAVIAAGDAQLGVVFDATGEMLRLPISSLVPFGHGKDTLGLIESAFHLKDRIMQVLSAEAMSRLPGLPRLINPDIDQQARDARRAQGRRRQAVSFRTSNRHMALPMEHIHEIIRLPTLEHSVLATASCLGWLHLRGCPVPVINFATYLGLEGVAVPLADGEDGEDLRRVLVLRRDDAYLGLLVDEVESIVAFLEAQLLPIPTIRGQAGLFAGCISRRDVSADDLLLIDAPALLLEPVVAELTQGHQDLYRVLDGERSGAEAVSQHARQTWVTFQLDRLMGLRIEQLREVIDYDLALVRPPGTPIHVRGVLNVRQTLITVIDLRTLYGMSDAEDLARSKILVVEHEGQKYGLVVDSLENIVSINSADTLRVPGLIANQLNTELRQDLCGVVDLDDQATALLLDARPLMQRLAGAGSPTPNLTISDQQSASESQPS